MENCALCGKELVLGCDAHTICKKHLRSLRDLYEHGFDDCKKAVLVEIEKEKYSGLNSLMRAGAYLLEDKISALTPQPKG